MSRLPAATLCLFLAFASGWIGLQEMRSTELAKNLHSRALPTTPANQTPNPWTSATVRQLMKSCETALRPDWSAVTPRLLHKTNIETCLGLATQTKWRWPTDGFADLILASVALQTGDLGAFAENMSSAQDLAPNEGWQSERRVVLLLSALERYEPENQADIASLISAEFDTLLRTQSGAELLATYYLFRPSIREELTLAVNRALHADQERFLNQLRMRGLT